MENCAWGIVQWVGKGNYKWRKSIGKMYGENGRIVHVFAGHGVHAQKEMSLERVHSMVEFNTPS